MMTKTERMQMIQILTQTLLTGQRLLSNQNWTISVQFFKVLNRLQSNWKKRKKSQENAKLQSNTKETHWRHYPGTNEPSCSLQRKVFLGFSSSSISQSRPRSSSQAWEPWMTWNKHNQPNNIQSEKRKKKTHPMKMGLEWIWPHLQSHQLMWLPQAWHQHSQPVQLPQTWWANCAGLMLQAQQHLRWWWRWWKCVRKAIWMACRMSRMSQMNRDQRWWESWCWGQSGLMLFSCRAHAMTLHMRSLRKVYLAITRTQTLVATKWRGGELHQ